MRLEVPTGQTKPAAQGSGRAARVVALEQGWAHQISEKLQTLFHSVDIWIVKLGPESGPKQLAANGHHWGSLQDANSQSVYHELSLPFSALVLKISIQKMPRHKNVPQDR